MTDAEYEELKYAAIAMGEKPVRLTDDGTALLMWGIDDPWNPRTNDRDAFRLAVRIYLGVEVWFGSSEYAQGVTLVESDYSRSEVPHNGDPYAATRLAITRAAAEMGKQMGGGDV